VSGTLRVTGRSRWFGYAVLAVCLVSGCALFSEPPPREPGATGNTFLPPLQPPDGAVDLQVVFVERPAGDELASQLAWQRLDQLGAVEADQRTILERNGFRVALAGSQPPQSLQTLLGMTTDVSEMGRSDRGVAGRRLSVRSGQLTEIQTTTQPFDCTAIFHPKAPTASARSAEPVRFEQVRGVLRTRVTRLRDGWVLLEFTPEIHHGQGLMRPQATEAGWSMTGSQLVDQRAELKFQVKLNSGEFVVVGRDPALTESAADVFFGYGSRGEKIERLLVIRVAHSGQSESSIWK
jgi:hypothetical protein